MATTQQVIWIPWDNTVKNFTGGRPAPVLLASKPSRLYTIIGAQDEAVKPGLPISPVHLSNVFCEDIVHDWNWRDGVLRYFSRVMDRGTWVLVEFDAVSKG